MVSSDGSVCRLPGRRRTRVPRSPRREAREPDAGRVECHPLHLPREVPTNHRHRCFPRSHRCFPRHHLLRELHCPRCRRCRRSIRRTRHHRKRQILLLHSRRETRRALSSARLSEGLEAEVTQGLLPLPESGQNYTAEAWRHRDRREGHSCSRRRGAGEIPILRQSRQAKRLGLPAPPDARRPAGRGRRRASHVPRSSRRVGRPEGLVHWDLQGREEPEERFSCRSR